VVKIYFSLWFALAAIFALVFMLGNLTLITLVIFGFMAFGMTFMGMMGVLPAVVTNATHPSEKSEFESPSETVTIKQSKDRTSRRVSIEAKAA